jgi:tRNA-guanine family transglycosylase
MEVVSGHNSTPGCRRNVSVLELPGQGQNAMGAKLPIPVRQRQIQLNGQTLETPIVWLGQSVDTSVIPARVPEMRTWPVLTSLGDAMRRERYAHTHFNGHLRSKLGLRGPIMVDSGGFVLMTRKVTNWSAARVAEIYRRVDADVLVSLDFPVLHADTSAVRKKKLQFTIDQLKRLAGEFGPDKLMPVIHGATPNEIECSCGAVRAITPRPRWIGLGGLVPLLRRFGRKEMGESRRHYYHFSMTLAAVRRTFPHSVIHVFGAGAPRSCLAAFAMGAHSADSQGWRQAAGFGSIYLPGRGQRILQWTRPTNPPRPIIDESDHQLLEACMCPACREHEHPARRIRILKRHFEARSIHNAWVLTKEVSAFRVAAQEGALAPFLRSRLPKTWLEIVRFFDHSSYI